MAYKLRRAANVAAVGDRLYNVIWTQPAELQEIFTGIFECC